MRRAPEEQRTETGCVRCMCTWNTFTRVFYAFFMCAAVPCWFILRTVNSTAVRRPSILPTLCACACRFDGANYHRIPILYILCTVRKVFKHSLDHWRWRVCGWTSDMRAQQQIVCVRVRFCVWGEFPMCVRMMPCRAECSQLACADADVRC